MATRADELVKLKGEEKVGTLKKGFAMMEDAGMAQRLGDEEWDGHRDRNVQRRQSSGQTVRGDIPVARSQQQAEYARLKEIAEQAKRDADLAAKLGEADLAAHTQRVHEREIQAIADAEHAAREAEAAAQAAGDANAARKIRESADAEIALRFHQEEERELQLHRQERSKLESQHLSDAEFALQLAQMDEQASKLHIDRDAAIARRLHEAGSPERGGVPRPPSEHDPLAGSLMSPEMIARQMAALQRLEAARATSGAGAATDADADAADSDGSYDC